MSEAAVCRALACHLWDAGERPDSDTELPRRLRDLVSRALAGRVLTRRTLMWFVEAFTMRGADRDALLSLLSTPDAGDENALGNHRADPPHSRAGRTLSQSLDGGQSPTAATHSQMWVSTRQGPAGNAGIIVTMVLPPDAATAAGEHLDVLVRIGVHEYHSRASLAHMAHLHRGVGVALGLDVPISERRSVAG